MDIRKIRIEEINPAPYNPRKDLQPDDPKFKQIEGSIDSFGLVEPLVWNERSGNLVGGHQRLKVLIQKGCKEVDVSVVDLDPEQEKALNIALNKVQGAWDESKLAVLMDELSKSPTFDIGITGFDAPELSDILDRYAEGKEDDFDVDAVVETIETPVTKRGDLIELGAHRILCGDSANADDVRCLMGSEQAQLLNIDPPYSVQYVPGNRPIKQTKNKKPDHSKTIQNDCMPQEDYEKWLKQVLGNISQFLEGNASAYIWNGFRQFGPMTQMLIDLGFHISNVITWVKPSICISYSDYNFQSEYCMYGWRQGQGAHKWHGATNESNVWYEKRDNPNLRIHQNQKPIELAQRAIKNSTLRNEIVLDCFLGSGFSLIAAESLGRRCYGIEIDPKYCDAIVRRYINYVGISKVPETLQQKYLTEVTHG